ncbi:protein kinase domain-containing protein [Kaarinaea lacus]
MAKKTKKKLEIESFDFPPGRILAKKFEVVSKLGEGWEGEVYLVREMLTNIERAAKFFFPQRNPGNKAFKFYAQKLHKLRHCPILIQYFSQDTITYRGFPITFLVSDYIEGELLSAFINRQPGKRLSAFQALHLLHALAKGMESIHHALEYHGDLHTDNIIISRFGLSYDLKLIDMYYWKSARYENIRYDVVSLIKIFHEALGGQKHYAKQSKEVKDIICGLKSSLILKKFKTAGELRDYLENMQWQ